MYLQRYPAIDIGSTVYQLATRMCINFTVYMCMYMYVTECACVGESVAFSPVQMYKMYLLLFKNVISIIITTNPLEIASPDVIVFSLRNILVCGIL